MNHSLVTRQRQTAPVVRREPLPPFVQSDMEQQLVHLSAARKKGSWLCWGLVAVLVLFVVASASFFQIGGAIIIDGNIRAGGDPLAIQHKDGGIVAQVRAKNGQFVNKGDIVLLLDPREINENISAGEDRLKRIDWRKKALSGLLDGDYAYRAGSIVSANSETRWFQAEKLRLENEKNLLLNQIASARSQIEGLNRQLTADKNRLSVTAQELRGLRNLFDRGLTDQSRLRGLERLVEELNSSIAARETEIALQESKILEINSNMQLMDSSRKTAWLDEIKTLEEEEEQIRSRINQLQLRHERLALRAPASGEIIELDDKREGSLVSPGDVVMRLVPRDIDNVIEARLPPQSVEKVVKGQKVEVDLSTIDPILSQKLPGEINIVSADVSFDEFGSAYYRVEVMPLHNELMELRPGTPVRILIPTKIETILSRVVSPLRERIVLASRQG